MNDENQKESIGIAIQRGRIDFLEREFERMAALLAEEKQHLEQMEKDWADRVASISK